MNDALATLLTSTDWNSEWKELQRRRRPPDNAEYWNKRAATFHTSDAPSAYTLQFLEYAGIVADETVFDMGCGNGALALPLAKAGNTVVAADFSQGMLDDLRRKADAQGLSPHVRTHLLSWEDDWEQAGIARQCVDVAIASRSIATADMRQSLTKLSGVARRRACATLTTGPSPHVDPNVLEALDLPVPRNYDYLYAELILTQMGYLPEVRIIQNHRMKSYSDAVEAQQDLESMIDRFAAPLTSPDRVQAAKAQLAPWLADNLVANENAGRDDGHGACEKALRLRTPRPITWAFLSWDTRTTPKAAW